jgi:hypothetical protein
MFLEFSVSCLKENHSLNAELLWHRHQGVKETFRIYMSLQVMLKQLSQQSQIPPWSPLSMVHVAAGEERRQPSQYVNLVLSVHYLPIQYTVYTFTAWLNAQT